jgi:hypothetical protein
VQRDMVRVETAPQKPLFKKTWRLPEVEKVAAR